MALDITPTTRLAPDALSDAELTQDMERISGSLATRTAETQQIAQDLRSAFGHINTLITKHEAHGERLAGLEEAARVAIDIVTVDAERKLATAIDHAETRVVEALTLSEQQQHELARWRNEIEENLRARLRELGEWDEALTETRNDIGGMREMAEAAMALASGDLENRWNAMTREQEKRWDQLGRELREILATAESDERARWEAYMATAADTLAAGANGDPAVVDRLRADVATLHDNVGRAVTTLQQHQQGQREQVASLRSELHTLIESERSRTVAAVDQRIGDAKVALETQTKAMQTLQSQVSQEVTTLRDAATAAEQRTRAATTTLQAEAQKALDTLQSAIEHGVEQARVAAQSELSGIRAELDRVSFQARAATQVETGAIRMDSERAMRKMQKQVQMWQSLSLVIAVIALTVGIGAFAVAYLHLH